MRSAARRWTVLVYANGNNELEPEIWRSVQELLGLDLGDDVALVIQIGRAREELVRAIRPALDYHKTPPPWVGVRRFAVWRGESKLIADLGEVSMADPRLLYDFLVRSAQRFPAERYMLILSGHSVALLGLLADYCADFPRMIPIPQLCAVLRQFGQSIRGRIDLLLVDACYMNSLEFVCECAADERPVSAVLLAPAQQNASLEGVAYTSLLRSLCRVAHLGTKEVAAELVAGTADATDAGVGIVAIDVDSVKLEPVRQLAQPFIKALHTSDAVYDESVLLELARPALEAGQGLVLSASGAHANLTLWLPDEPAQFARYQAWYDQLAICKEPAGSCPPAASALNELTLIPLPMLLQNLLVYNPSLSQDDLYRLAHSLGWTGEPVG